MEHTPTPQAVEATHWRLLAFLLEHAILPLAAWSCAALGAVTVRAPVRERRILHINSGRYSQWVELRNARDQFITRELGDFDGYFQEVHVSFFPAGRRESVDLTERHHLHDFDMLAPTSIPAPFVSLVRFVAFIRWARGLILCNRIGVVQGLDAQFRGLAALLLARLCRIRHTQFICRDFDLDYQQIGKLALEGTWPTRGIEKAVERFVFRHADLVVADRAYYLRYPIRSGAAPERTGHAWMIADDAYYVEPSRRGSPDVRLSGPTLLYVGRLSPEKHVSDAVRSLALVRESQPDAELLLIGDGPLRSDLEDLARGLGVGSATRFIEHLSAGRLAALLSSAQVCLGTHMGFTLIEAALSGIPIVAYDYEAHPEFITHCETGVLVPFGDHRSMASWVLRILADPALASRLATNARARALERHQRGRSIQQYRRLYSAILE